jgi:hypothetical protein
VECAARGRTRGIGEDPGGEKAQLLAKRWMELVDASTGGDPKVKQGFNDAWRDRRNWPAWQQDYVSSIESLAEFIGRAIDAPLRKYFTEEAWAKRGNGVKQAVPEQLSLRLRARAELFRDLESALGEDPGGEPAKALKARWHQIRINEAGADPDILAGSTKAWVDRRNWPMTIRLREATTYGMTLARFEEVADFLDRIP